MQQNEATERIRELLGLENLWQQIPWPLPNMMESTEEAYWHWRTTYTPRHEENCGQIKIAESGGGFHGTNPRWASIILCLVDHSQYIGGGFAIAFEYWAKENKVRYYTWTKCDHKFRARTVGNCLTRYTCTECEQSYEIDSSD